MRHRVLSGLVACALALLTSSVSSVTQAAPQSSSSKPAALVPLPMANLDLPSYWKDNSTLVKMLPYATQATPLSQGFDWWRVCLIKRYNGDYVIIDFGVLIGIDDSGKKTNDYVGTTVFSPDTATTGKFTMSFKTDADGTSPIIITDHYGDQLQRTQEVTKSRIVKNVKSLTVSFQRGVVPVAYTVRDFVIVSSENGRDPMLNAYVLTQLYLPNGKPLLDIQRLRQICYAYPLEVDVNNKSVLYESLRRRFNGVAAYMNERMSQINEPLDNLVGYTSLTSNDPTSTLDKGQKTRVFSRIYLSPEEKYMLGRLSYLQEHGASKFEIYSFTKLLNRALIDRLLMERWDMSVYLYASSEWSTMMQATSPWSMLDLGNMSVGKINRPYLVPPTYIFGIQWSTQ